MTEKMQREPALVCTYGPSGSGKTTELGYSFPNGVFIAGRGALQSVLSVCGHMPRRVEANTIDDATRFLLKLKKKDGVDAVVVDDFSFLAEQTFAVYDKRFTGWKMWGALRDSTIAFRNAARMADCHVVVNCWEQPPKLKADGHRIKGGPMLSGKLPEQVPAMCDVVLRCAFEPARKPWSGVYRCHYSADYVMKDRFDIASRVDPAPMNLAELLRAAGYTISRHPDLGWQEDVVEGLAEKLAVSEVVATDANAAYSILLKQGVSAPAARWSVRDALDRAIIRRALAVSDQTFIL